jgi:hypothetical protein
MTNLKLILPTGFEANERENTRAHYNIDTSNPFLKVSAGRQLLVNLMLYDQHVVLEGSR